MANIRVIQQGSYLIAKWSDANGENVVAGPARDEDGEVTITSIGGRGRVIIPPSARFYAPARPEAVEIIPAFV